MASSMASHPYLLGCLAIAMAALASAAAAPRSIRRSAWVAALLAAPFTLVSLDYGAYWHPARLGGLQLGLEDLLLSVASGVFLWSLPAGLAANRIRLQMDWAVLLRRYLGVTLAGAALVGICRGLGASPSLSLTTTMVAITAGVLALRPAYWRLATAGGASYLALYLTILKCSWSAFPAFSSQWNWAGMCGVTIFGIPLEEIGWAAGYGAVWPVMMAFTLRARVEPNALPQYTETADKRDGFSPFPDVLWRRMLSALRISVRTRTLLALSVFLGFYAFARMVEVYDAYLRTRQVAPPLLPQSAVVAMDILPAIGFALVHGLQHYRLRGISVFFGICLVMGNLVENLGVATGFPFGRYYFTEPMGPQLFHVPVLLGLAYIGMAYISWTLARMILGRPLEGVRVFALPLLASFIMTAWDLAQDPVWSTVLRCWVWVDGGPWFGVPISNYIGWLLNLFVMYLLFTLYLRRNPAPQVTVDRACWGPALLFYVTCAACNLLQMLPQVSPAAVQDPTGKPWLLDDILGASALVSIFVMGGFAVLAWLRLPRQADAVAD